MIKDLEHGMAITPPRDERARQEFVGALRAHVLGPMATSMKARFEEKALPRFRREAGRKPQDGAEVHDLMQGDDYFRFYSTVRYNAQEMVFRSVVPSVDRSSLDELNERGRQLRQGEGASANGGPEPSTCRGTWQTSTCTCHPAATTRNTTPTTWPPARSTTTPSMSSPSTRWVATSMTSAGPWPTTCG